MISQQTIDQVRERADILALIRENVRLQKRGRSWTGLCPFHKEKTPSFHVHPERGFFHCFGCGESGDAIGYLVKLEGHTFPEAVRALAERCGVIVEDDHTPEDRERSQRKRREKDELYDVSQLAAHYFEEQLAEGGHPIREIALAELVKRGLPHDGDEMTRAALSAFRIGYAPYAWDGLAAYLQQQGVSAELAEKLGIVVRRRGGDGFYDAFRHRLMFAVMDKTGRVVAFSGRALDEPSEELLRQHSIEPLYRPRPGSNEERRPPPKYVNSPESPIYIKGETLFGLHQARHAVRGKGHAVLVEGNFDVVSLHARGMLEVVAPLGTAFTAHQAKLIKRYAPAMVVLFDGDAAGKKATMALRVVAREVGLAVKVASLPAGSDPDDHARSKGIAAIEGLVSGAKGMLEYLIDATLDPGQASGASLSDTHTRIQQVMKLISEEADPNLRTLAKSYADRLSSQLVVDGRSPTDTRSLERMIRAAAAKGGRAATRDASSSPQVGVDDGGAAASAELGPQSKSQPSADAQQCSVLGALLDFPELTLDSAVETALSELSGDVALAALAVCRMWHAKKSLQGAELLDLLPQAVHSFAVGRLATPRFSELGEARDVLLDNIKKIRLRSLTGDRVARVQELDRAKGQGDVEAQDELLRELERVARTKRGLS